MNRSGLSVVALSLFVAGSSAGQVRQEYSAEAQYWRFSGGLSAPASSRWAPTLHAGLRPGAMSRLSFSLALGAAPSDLEAPGLVAGTFDVALKLFRPGLRPRFNLLLQGGLGEVRFSAAGPTFAPVFCPMGQLCARESVSFESGWRTMASGGLGLEVPVGGKAVLTPQIGAVKLLGSGVGGPPNDDLVLRVGFGIGLR